MCSKYSVFISKDIFSSKFISARLLDLDLYDIYKPKNRLRSKSSYYISKGFWPILVIILCRDISFIYISQKTRESEQKMHFFMLDHFTLYVVKYFQGSALTKYTICKTEDYCSWGLAAILPGSKVNIMISNFYIFD